MHPQTDYTLQRMMMVMVIADDDDDDDDDGGYRAPYRPTVPYLHISD